MRAPGPDSTASTPPICRTSLRTMVEPRLPVSAKVAGVIPPMPSSATCRRTRSLADLSTSIVIVPWLRSTNACLMALVISSFAISPTGKAVSMSTTIGSRPVCICRLIPRAPPISIEAMSRISSLRSMRRRSAAPYSFSCISAMLVTRCRHASSMVLASASDASSPCRVSMLATTWRLFFTRWWISFSSSSFSCSDACRRCSAARRAVMSRTELMTSVRPLDSSELSEISTGNTEPSARRPSSSRPSPLARARGRST